MTFEEFLRDCIDHGHTQVKLVPRYGEHDVVYFYATGQCGSESCKDFEGSAEGDIIAGPEEIAVDGLTELEQRADEEAENAREGTGLTEGDFGDEVPVSKKVKKAKGTKAPEVDLNEG